MQKNLTFFLADDDPDDREFFTLALRKIDPTIKCVITKVGCEALDFFKENESFIPDFIFLDFNMPRVNGKECFLELRKINRIRLAPAG